MDESQSPAPRRKYLWPRFALAGVIAGILLAVVWMSAEFKRLHDNKRRAAGFASATRPTDSIPASERWGDSERGRKIFFEKPEANCAKCHQAGGAGTAELGPPLDGIRSRRSREELLESMVKPNAKTTEGYETVILLLKNGTGLSGLLKQETESELVVLTAEDGPVTVRKENVQLRQTGLSPMPEGLDQLLAEQDLRDLVEFMYSLP